MSCKSCQQSIRPVKYDMNPASLPSGPCRPCVLEHIRLAEEAHHAGKLYRAVWHLAQAATHAATPRQAEVLRLARINLQRINNKSPDFAKLREPTN